MDLTKLKLNWLDLISVILYYAKKKKKKMMEEIKLN